MIENLAKRLKAWGKWYDAEMLAALPKWARDTVKKELNEMTKPTTPTPPDIFIVGREHTRKDGEFVYLAEYPEQDEPLSTTGIKVNAFGFSVPQDAQRAADRANRYLGIDVFKVGLPEQFRSDITASQRKAHKEHTLEELRANEIERLKRRSESSVEDEAGDNPMSLEEWQARRDALVEDYDARVRANIKEAAEALSGAKLVNGKELNKALNNNGESLKVNAIVERPAHYNQGSIDVIEALYRLLTWEQFKGFMQGNIIKYSVRFEDKDDPILDLEKAEYYTKRLKEYRKKHHEAELREKEGRS